VKSKKGAKLQISVGFKPTRHSQDTLSQAYELLIPSNSFDVGFEVIPNAKPRKAHVTAKKAVNI
jgi:hypothetical protein